MQSPIKVFRGSNGGEDLYSIIDLAAVIRIDQDKYTGNCTFFLEGQTEDNGRMETREKFETISKLLLDDNR